MKMNDVEKENRTAYGMLNWRHWWHKIWYRFNGISFPSHIELNIIFTLEVCIIKYSDVIRITSLYQGFSRSGNSNITIAYSSNCRDEK